MKFSDIVGQESIKDYLRKIVEQQKVSHALMFAGPQGSGKLATALAFAQYLICSNPQNGEPCGVCNSCRKIESFNHPDVIFIYPTISSTKHKHNYSNNYIKEWQEMLKNSPYFSLSEWLEKITGGQTNKQASIFKDDSEEIIRRLSVKSFESENRIIIIWQADKMNSVAANKILKILEEPQPNTYFILTTEKPDAILPTIISRTQLIKFPSVKTSKILEWLEAKYPELKEWQQINISKLADGNVIYARQLAELYLKNESLEFFNLFVELTRNAYAYNFLRINDLVLRIDELTAEQQKVFINYMIRIFRGAYLYNLNLPELTLLTNDEIEFIKKFSKFVSAKNIESIYKLLNQTYYAISRNANKKILWTDTIIKTGILLRKAK
jgi:DNA polymerase-3 subunit delta'